MYNSNYIGENLKKIRTEADLSLVDLARITGVSKTMLSQIERFKSTPTISTIWKIANGLKVTFTSLLGESAAYAIKSLENTVPSTDNKGHVEIYCLYPFSPLTGIEIFYGIFKPGCAHISCGHKRGLIEHLFVYEGELTLITGKQSYVIPARSWISFDPTLEHKYYNLSESEVKAHMVLTYA